MAIISAPEVAGTTGAKEGNRTLRRLLWASSISMLGSHVTTIAYPLLVLRLTGSPFTAGCVAFAATAPGILVHIPAGALVDRWNPRQAMLVSELGRGVAIATVALTVTLGRAMVSLWIAMAVVEGVLEVFSGLAERRYVGSLVEHSQVSSVLVRIEGRTHLVLVAGRPLGGLLFEISPIFPFAVDVLSFIYSVLTLNKIEDGQKSPENVSEKFREASPRSSLSSDMRQGLRQIRNDPFALRAIGSFSTGTLIFQALIMVFLGDAHSQKLSAFATGLVLAASGIGGAIGSALTSRIPVAGSHSWIRIQTLIWTAGFFVFIFPFGRNFMIAAIVMAVLGFSGALGNIALNTHLMQDGNKEMLARVTSVSRLATVSACSIGPVLGGVLVQELGVHSAMIFLLLFTPVLMLLSFRTPPTSNAQETARAGRENYRQEVEEPERENLDWALIVAPARVDATEIRLTDADVRMARRVLHPPLVQPDPHDVALQDPAAQLLRSR